ncbi:tRNA pseudouridine(55) synthase TruB [Lacrimispora sp. NSJ-141]|uniref:tRNA pseudouridine synthase B n=1 Tax=Lientehia hominis TaxID=2897778 RepID=A0AAP2W7Z7_9FIRM|nr:tRNA pseudouridine(55) synthase TruB [Lientehia hominis]MCD2491605.1 tRNA pseudouridine(55) synthase TruB [Lientehia hominis]
MDGLLNIYKERGFTSHDVVAKLRGILKQKKIGHTGTLDPDAEGVLPVCLGKATKVCELLADKNKTYRAVLLLGIETDTQDVTGQITARSSADVDEESVREAVLSFIGPYAQVPPMYSALKVGGKKLYELARQGKEIERAARPVTIHEIVIEKVELPRVTLTVTCSKGTYIRTLCHDIGKKLGCGGCMESLVRVRVAGFRMEDALTLSQVELLRDEGVLEEELISIDSLFQEYPAYLAAKGTEKLLYNGNPLKLSELDRREEDRTGTDISEETENESEEKIRLYDRHGQFMGIYSFDEAIRRYRPVKLFFTVSDGGMEERQWK